MLAEIQADHGDQAKIVECNRLWAPGVAGLFARRQYELFVESSQAAQTNDSDLERGSPSGFDTLLEQRLVEQDEADEIRLAMITGSGLVDEELVCDAGDSTDE